MKKQDEEKLSPKALKKHEASESKSFEKKEDAMPMKKKKSKKIPTSDGYMESNN